MGVWLLVHNKAKLLVLMFVLTNYNKSTRGTWITGQNNTLVATQYMETTTTTKTTVAATTTFESTATFTSTTSTSDRTFTTGSYL